jgi:uncharacterized protein YjbI with pentapeptide repeats
MNRDKSIALWRQGKEVWNAWADDMLRQKAELEKAGTWQVKEEEVTTEGFAKTGYAIQGQSDETRKWIDAACIDLSGVRFIMHGFADAARSSGEQNEDLFEVVAKALAVEGGAIGFDGFVFPWRADFRKAKFCGPVSFENAQFHGWADFDDARFLGEARFGGEARLGGEEQLKAAHFHQRANFRRTHFYGEAQFWDVQFRERGDFWLAQFHGTAHFRRAEFHGQADFASANFESSASFKGAKFSGKTKQDFANFTAMKAGSAFYLTGVEFSQPPAFNQTDFKQAPDLDDVSFPDQSFWSRGDKELTARYRHIKRLAVSGFDYEREQIAFKSELRSRRWVIDKWDGPSVWLGLIYDAVSDCGRSIWQPFATWAALAVWFAAFYYSRLNVPSPPDSLARRCGDAEPMLQALFLSIKNGLVVFGGTRDARVNQAYLCLYGGEGSQANIPLSVTYAETLLQTPISAVLLFLFLLAVRNQFKIK